MKVKEFLTIPDISIDICDDYDERCYIAYESDGDYINYESGAEMLTEYAQEKFKRALDLNISYSDNGYIAIIHCDNARDAENAKELFFALAGFCSLEKYNKYFNVK